MINKYILIFSSSLLLLSCGNNEENNNREDEKTVIDTLGEENRSVSKKEIKLTREECIQKILNEDKKASEFFAKVMCTPEG